jgi:hypothetical protein
VVQVDRNGHTRAGGERAGRRRGHLDAAEVLDVRRIELQEHGSAIRHGRVQHPERHLEVGDVEAA